jgi:hypothetical protein
MAPGPYIGGLIQIRPQWKDESASIHECVTWWQSADPTPKTFAEMQNIVTTFDTIYSAAWASIGAATAHYQGSIATDFTSNTGEQATSVGVAPVAGTVAGLALPNNVALLTSLHIAQRYKGGHGRMYFPCLGSTVGIDGDHASNTNVSAVQSDLSAMTNSGVASPNVALGTVTAGSGLLWCVLRHRASGVPTLPAVVGCTVQALYASQRRRLRKAAHH